MAHSPIIERRLARIDRAIETALAAIRPHPGISAPEQSYALRVLRRLRRLNSIRARLSRRGELHPFCETCDLIREVLRDREAWRQDPVRPAHRKQARLKPLSANGGSVRPGTRLRAAQEFVASAVAEVLVPISRQAREGDIYPSSGPLAGHRPARPSLASPPLHPRRNQPFRTPGSLRDPREVRICADPACACPLHKVVPDGD